MSQVLDALASASGGAVACEGKVTFLSSADAKEYALPASLTILLNHTRTYPHHSLITPLLIDGTLIEAKLKGGD